ncbi:MAG: ZPR1 zinc finger domain-containing protein [Thermoplasmataceae archaeon]
MNNEEIPIEFETATECPACGRNLFFIFYRTKVSYEEAIEIETYFCKNCLYKSTKIHGIENYGHKKLVLKIRNPNDLRILVYRSPEARVEIPEFFAEINPGEMSSGEITTVEGILSRLLEKIDLFDQEDADPETIEALRERISGTINGKWNPFTLVVDDPTGRSRINSSRVITLKISPENQ